MFRMSTTSLWRRRGHARQSKHSEPNQHGRVHDNEPIEVFESGSNGEIIKLFQEDVKDVLEDTVLKKGFSKELFLDVDANNADIISEQQRIIKQQERQREVAFRRLQKRLERKIVR